MATEKKPLKDPYDFYDEYEIEDINTGENYAYNAAPAKFGLIGGAIAAVACLVMIGLMGAIYHRDKYSVPLSHLIMVIIGLLVAGLAAGVCAMTAGAMARRGNVNHMLIGVGLILALTFFVYFLASGVYMFMYRPFHHSHMIDNFNNKTRWNKLFKATWTFEKGWGTDRRILWWNTFFCIIAAIGFLIASICLWLLSQFPVQSARMALGAACFGGAILGCFAIDYLWTARDRVSNYAMRDLDHNMLDTLLILIAVGVGLLFLNAILNLLKKRIGHFILGILLIFFLFVFVSILGLVLRDLRQRQFKNTNDNSKCATILDSLHQDDIKAGCASKYITGTCSKEFIASRWESDGSAAFLNPACCLGVNSWLLWPLYISGCLCLLMVGAILVAIAFNLYLSDPSEYLDFADKKFGLFELVFLVLIILLLIAFGFYFGFRKNKPGPRENKFNPEVVRSKYLQKITGYTDNEFDPVDLERVYKGKVPVNAFSSTGGSSEVDIGTDADARATMRTKNSVLTLATDPALCPQDVPCGFRIGILAVNGRLINAPKDSRIVGSSEARPLFFDDSNINNDFILLFGSASALNQAIAQIGITPNDISKDSRLVFKSEQLNLNSLDSLGLKNGEKTSPIVLSANSNSFNDYTTYIVKGYQNDLTCYYNNECVSDLKCIENGEAQCKRAFVFYPSNGEIEVVVPLRVFNSAGKKINYADHSLRSSSYYNHNGNKIYLHNVTLVDSALRIRVPNPTTSATKLHLNLYDKDNKYLPTSRIYEIPVRSPAVYNADEIQLITKNGKGCVGDKDEDACFASAILQYTNIEAAVKDIETNQPLKNIQLKLYAGEDSNKYLSKQNTSENGYATFANVAYDYYTVKFDGDDTYLPARASFKLQSEINGDVTLLLNRKDSTTATLDEYISNDDQDKDFALSIVSHNGKSCKVDSLTKYCAYAAYISDVQKNNAGYEKIRIDRFTVSHYLAYLKDAPTYSGTCSAPLTSQTPYYSKSETTLRSLSYDWSTVRKLDNPAVNYQTLYCFTGWGLNSKKVYRQTSTGAEPTAKICAPLYPSDSVYSVEKLHAANK